MSAKLADVVQLPVRQVGTVAADTMAGAAAAARRMGRPSEREIDDWGRDADAAAVAEAMSRLRWDIATGGIEHLPEDRGALIVVNSRRFALTPIYTAIALTRAAGRPVRYAGRSDVAPLGPLERQIGGLLPIPDEIAGALRAHQLVVIAAAPTIRPRRVGTVDHAFVGAALAAGAAVLPAASTSSPFGRQARVEIGAAVRAPRKRRGPLAELELADVIQRQIASLLDEMGDINTGTPLDWLPMSGLGSH